MKLEVGRVAMNKAVELVGRALPSKDYGDATSGILLDVKGNKLSLVANSIEVFISTEITLLDKAEADGFAVPNGDILSRIVANLKNLNKPIVIEFNEDKDELGLSCESYAGTIAHYPSEGFISIPSVKDIKKNSKMSIPARLLTDAVQRVAFARSKDTTHVQLTGIFIDQTENGINLVATDSLRLSAIQYASKVKNPKSVVIGYKYLDLLRRILDDLEIDGGQTLNLYISEDRIYFVHEESNTTIGLQTYGDQFVEGYAGFIIPQDDCEVLIKVNREHFISRLDLATSHNKSIQDDLIFEIATKKKVVTSKFKSSESGSKLNDFDVPFDVVKIIKGDGFSVSVVPQFLYDVLSVIRDKEVILGLANKEEGPIAVYPIVEGNSISGEFVHVFSLT